MKLTRLLIAVFMITALMWGMVILQPVHASMDDAANGKEYTFQLKPPVLNVASNEDYPAIEADTTATGEITSGGEYVFFRFTPEYAESYTFSSECDYDTYGYLYDSEMNQLSYDDDGGVNQNCSITHTLDAGKSYIWAVRFYNASQTGSVTVSLRTNHDYVGSVSVPATCTENGVMVYVCSICGLNYEEEIEAGHSWNEEGVCTVCNEAYIASGVCGSNLTWVLTQDGALTVSGSGTMTDYSSSSSTPWYSIKDSIESVVLQNGVESIGSRAFSGCVNMKSVIIPDSVASVGTYAFSGCSGLTEVVIPDSVTTIGSAAFTGCSSLKNITLPFVGDSVKTASNTYQYPFGYIFGTSSYTGGTAVEQYYYNSSTGATTNTTYYIPTTLQYVTITGGNILRGAFYNCKQLLSITLPEGITEIGANAFYYCSGLTEIRIPDTVTSIGSNAFYNCNKLKEITLPESVTTIGSYAFSNCTSAESINIPSGVTEISDRAFYNCTSLKAVVIPEGVTRIGDYAFYNCNLPTSIIIPDSVISIGTYAFAKWTGLTEVVVPDSVTTIGNAAFTGCSSLKNITLPFVGDSVKTASNTYQYPFGYIFGTSSYTGGTAVEQYYYNSSTGATTNTTYYIPTTLQYVTITGGNILRGAFYNCSQLLSITLPEGITEIGANAFYYCSGLTEIRIPDTVTSIGSNAFYNCNKLKEITLPESVTTIGSYAFSNCTSAESINIPSGVTEISDRAFYNCTSLKAVVIPEGVTRIGDYAFYNCNLPTSIIIPDSVTSIGTYAFAKWTGLTEVVVPDSVTTIGNAAFTGCSSLKNITLPFVGDSVKTASNTYQYPFGYIFGTSSYTGGTAVDQSYYNSSTSTTTSTRYYIPTTLQYVTITGGNILRGAFYNCKQLLSITLPEGITEIGANAFYYCSGLTEIRIPDTVTNIGSYAFAYCNNLEQITLPDGVAVIGSDAFSNCTKITEIILPESVTTIGSYAFYNCTKLTEIKIPHTVTAMNSYAFGKCSSLNRIIFKGRAPAFGGDNVFDSVTATAYYPENEETWTEEVLLNYGGTITWEPYDAEEVIYVVDSGSCGENLTWTLSEDDILIISGTGMMDNYTAYSAPWYQYKETIKAVIIRDGVESIGDYAFSHCGTVEQITFECHAPIFGNEVFNDVTAVAYYPNHDNTWTEDVMRDYGGDITWSVYTNIRGYQATYTSASISLAGDIGVNYYVQLSEGALADPGTYMQFTIAGETQIVPVSEAWVSVDSNGVTTYRFSCKVSARQMTQTIIGQMYTSDGIAFGEERKYSVKAYCDAAIPIYSQYEAYADLVALMKAMLNYGAYSQVHFDYSTDCLANADLADAEKVLPETVDAAAYAHSVLGAEDGIMVYSASLLLESKTTIRFYFRLTGDKPIDAYEFLVDGTAAEPIANGSLYYIDVPDVSAKDLDEIHTVTVGGLSVSYYGLSYVNQTLSWDGVTDAAKNVVKALYVYNQAANAYFD